MHTTVTRHAAAPAPHRSSKTSRSKQPPRAPSAHTHTAATSTDGQLLRPAGDALDRPDEPPRSQCLPTTLRDGWLTGGGDDAAVSTHLDRVVIVHDSENCIVPQAAHAHADALRRAVTREAVEVAFGQQPQVLAVDVPVEWHLVLPSRDVRRTAFSLHPAFVRQAAAAGYTVCEAPDKPGAVDHIVRDRLDAVHSHSGTRGTGGGGDAARTLVVLLSADGDMTAPLRRLQGAGHTVVRLHGGNTNGARIVDTRGRLRDAPSWRRIVRHASDNKYGVTSWAWPGAKRAAAAGARGKRASSAADASTTGAAAGAADAKAPCSTCKAVCVGYGVGAAVLLTAVLLGLAAAALRAVLEG